MCNKYSDEEIAYIESKMKEQDERIEKQDKKITELCNEILELKKKLEEYAQYEKEKAESMFKPDVKAGKKNKRGAKLGHKAHSRPIPDHVDETEELKTNTCPDCGTSLEGLEPVEKIARYVEDIVPSKMRVKKIIRYRKRCPNCKKIVCEKPKDVLPKCRFGFNLMLFIVFYKYILNVTVNKIQKVLRIEYGFDVCEGTIINELDNFAMAIGPDFKKIFDDMKNEHYINADETGGRVNGKNHWLWVFASKTKVLYLMRQSRGSKVPKEVLGEDFEGVVSSDFWNAYNWIKNQQKCWAHVLVKTAKGPFLKDFILHRRVKKIYNQAKKLENETDYAKKEKGVKNLIKQVEELRTIPFNTKEARAYAGTLGDHKDNLFRFVFDEEVEATNNRAEQKIRPCVIARKISGGNRSHKGARTLETNTSVIETWNCQGKDFFEAGWGSLLDFVSHR
jgi:transposase